MAYLKNAPYEKLTFTGQFFFIVDELRRPLLWHFLSAPALQAKTILWNLKRLVQSLFGSGNANESILLSNVFVDFS